MKESVCCIYCIENNIDGKKYIGQTSNFESRRRSHLYELRKNNHPNKRLQESFNMFGEDTFIFYILERCDQRALDSLERYYINLFNTMNEDTGYNRESGGNAKKYASEETKRLISFHHADVSGVNNPMYGVKHTESSIKKFMSNENYKNRRHKGEDSHLCSISEETAIAIKKHFSDGHEAYRGEISDIAKKYNTSTMIVSHIKNGHAWNWLEV